MIELPKDAEGREIPLDTVVLFSRSGEAYNIVHWIYTTDFENWTESNMWRAIDENNLAIDPELMYLEKHDSIKQLAEDLNRSWDACNAHGKGCRYMPCYYDNDRGEHCNDCRLNSHGKMACFDSMMADIVSRVNRLAGDSE